MKTNTVAVEKIKALHLQFAFDRGLEKTYCPSEVAKKFAPTNWREYMGLVREVADELITSNKLEVLQKGEIMNCKATEAVGPIRLRIADK